MESNKNNKSVMEQFRMDPKKGLEFGLYSLGDHMPNPLEKKRISAEQQLKPILSFMKANIVQNYVFALQQDIVQGKIISQDVLYRQDRLVDEVMLSARAYREMKAWEDDQYDF